MIFRDEIGIRGVLPPKSAIISTIYFAVYEIGASPSGKKNELESSYQR